MSHETNRHERDQELLMKALDGELEAGEHQELEERLESRPELRRELDEMNRLKEVTNMSRIASPADAEWGAYWRSVYNRLERGVAWILLSIGAAIVASWGIWQALLEIPGFLDDPSTPMVVKLGVFALVAGGVVLTISVIREKWLTYRNDPYKEIER